MAFGMEAIAGGTDLLAVGEMGIGNTTVAAAIYAALYGGAPEAWVGRGTGVDDAGYARKVEAVTGALARHAGHLDDPLEVLRRLGGRDVAAIAGAILAARLQRIPVVLDGYVATAAAAVLHALEPAAIDHCVAGHLSAEGAHQEVLERLGKIPLLALGMRLGEGTGAALAVGLIRAAAACHRGMATFDEARRGGANRPVLGRPRPPLCRLDLHRRQCVHDARGREGDDHLGALARLRLQLEAAAVEVDEALDDRQPEARALLGGLDGERAAPEGLTSRSGSPLRECPGRCP